MTLYRRQRIPPAWPRNHGLIPSKVAAKIILRGQACMQQKTPRREVYQLIGLAGRIVAPGMRVVISSCQVTGFDSNVEDDDGDWWKGTSSHGRTGYVSKLYSMTISIYDVAHAASIR